MHHHIQIFIQGAVVFISGKVFQQLFPQQNSKSYSQAGKSIVRTVAQETGPWLWQQGPQCNGAGGGRRRGSGRSSDSGRLLVVLALAGVVTYTHTREYTADTF